MSLLARMVFAAVDFAARKGLAEFAADSAAESSAKHRAVRTGIRGETYAYWYLRRHGYVLVARNFTSPGTKGELDVVGYDGPVLAFVEVKTRSIAKDREATSSAGLQPKPEQAVNWEKRRNLRRMAGVIMRARRVEPQNCRFDVLAIETRPSAPPVVRLHKGAFGFSSEEDFQPRVS